PLRWRRLPLPPQRPSSPLRWRQLRLHLPNLQMMMATPCGLMPYGRSLSLSLEQESPPLLRQQVPFFARGAHRPESSDMIPAKKNIKSRSLAKVIVGYLPPFLHYRKEVSEGQKEHYSVIDFCSKMIDNGLDS
ncbi:unnamed protein product, partial [Ascophyllum nodosum]